MRRPDLDGSCWPDSNTERVLQAALLPRVEGIEAWKAVREVIPPREYVWADRPRLLPLVLANIGVDAAGPDAADMKRLHRKAWFENQQHLRHAPLWLDPLHDEVPVMLLKGMALTQRAYADLGLRSMSDVDLLVPTSRIGSAVELLTAAGWADAGGRPRPPSWRVRHAMGLVHPDGGHIDLHHVPGIPFLGPTRHGDAVPEMWDAQVAAELVGRPITVPAPEDLLLTVVVHGLTSILGSSSRWVADAMMLLRAEPMNWERFVAQATRYHVVVPSRSAMRYLVDVFDALVPADALTALWAVPIGSGELRRFDTVTGAVGASEMWHRSSSTRGRWARLRTALGPLDAVRALPRFVASDIAKVDQVREVPGALARRGRRRLVSRAVAR